MKIEKIVFLDIDGVLNSHNFYCARQSFPNKMFNSSDDRVKSFELREIDLVPLGLLYQLVIETGSKIVITSTWRLGRNPLYFRLLFYRKGIGFPEHTIIGKTDTLHAHTRGHEIEKWISDNNFTGRYVILDDDSDFLNYQKIQKISKI